MELGTVKRNILQAIGWVSVLMGLISLAIINISLLSGYDVAFGNNNFSSWVMLSFILGILAIFHQNSRKLGLWGIGLCLYIGLFVVVIFALGWTIVPFP